MVGLSTSFKGIHLYLTLIITILMTTIRTENSWTIVSSTPTKILKVLAVIMITTMRSTKKMNLKYQLINEVVMWFVHVVCLQISIKTNWEFFFPSVAAR